MEKLSGGCGSLIVFILFSICCRQLKLVRTRCGHESLLSHLHLSFMHITLTYISAALYVVGVKTNKVLNCDVLQSNTRIPAGRGLVVVA